MGTKGWRIGYVDGGEVWIVGDILSYVVELKEARQFGLCCWRFDPLGSCFLAEWCFCSRCGAFVLNSSRHNMVLTCSACRTTFWGGM